MNSILRVCEKKYYSTLLEQNVNNTKATWNVLNRILKRGSNVSQLPSEFINGKSVIKDKKVLQTALMISLLI